MKAIKTVGRFGLLLALVLVIVVGGFCYWQAPGSKLSTTELNSYLARMDADLPMAAAKKAEFLARLRSWGEADDGQPVHMLNLIRFHEQMLPVPGHPEFSGTAEEANAHYEQVVVPMLVARGVYPVFASVAQGVETESGMASNLLGFDTELDGWDRILLVRYPSRRAFLDLASDQTYLTVVPYKLAAIDLGFVPLDKHYMVPDLRWIVTLLAVGLFMILTRLPVGGMLYSKEKAR